MRAASLFLLCAAACTLPVEFAGKVCQTAFDCPAEYSCVEVRPGQLRTCELLAPPTAPNSATVRYYCSDVKPILDTYCLESCHGDVHTGSGRTDFRLDLYATAGGVKGAQAMALAIKQQAVDSTQMPPSNTTGPTPSPSERATLGDWVLTGAQECADGGT